MEALIVLAFCMTGFEHALRTYLPVFVKGHLPSRSGNLRQSPGLMGLGVDLRLAGHRQQGQL